MSIFFKKKESSPKNEVITITKTSNLPTVIFENKELQVKVGQWAEMLTSKKVSHIPGLSIYTHLDADELIKSAVIPKELYDMIANEFGKILLKVGVQPDEICIISGHDKDNFSFNCHLKNSDKDKKISLRWGDPIDNLPEIIVQDESKEERYEYYPEYDNKPSNLLLRFQTLYRNNNSLFRYLYGYDTMFRLSDGSKKLQLDVTRPDYITEAGYDGYQYRLNNEEELQEYLLELSFPIDINEVYKIISEISLDSIKDYPEIKIVVKDEKGNTTDEIKLHYGKLEKFTMTKNGKTVSIDNNGNWTVASPKVSINKSYDGKVNYILNMDSYEELIAYLDINQFTIANEEVSDAKQMIKTLFETK